MSRDIKFRAWHKLEEVMCGVDVLTFGKGAFLTGVEPGHDTHPIDVATGRPVADQTVLAPTDGRFCRMQTFNLMQYTGLKDKNGVEIYEGDIVYFEDFKTPWEIWFDRGFFQTRDAKGGSGYHGIWNFDDGQMEVIGNIFENPELFVMTAPKVVTLPAIFAGIRSRKDKSYSLTFDTRELGGDNASALLGMQQTECWVLVAPSEDAIDTAVVPNVKPDASINQKTPGQRLRAVIFVYWTQLGKPNDFEDFYRAKLEYLIDQYKEKLDGGEIRT